MNYCVNIFDKETRESSCVPYASLEDFVLDFSTDNDEDSAGAKFLLLLEARLAEKKASKTSDDDNVVWEDDKYIYTMLPAGNFSFPKLRVEYEPTQTNFGEFDSLKEWVKQWYYTPEDHEQWLEDYEEDEKYEDSVDYIVDEISYGSQYDEEENGYWNGYKFTWVEGE